MTPIYPSKGGVNLLRKSGVTLVRKTGVYLPRNMGVCLAGFSNLFRYARRKLCAI
jgi:hypothetical protein